MDMDRSRSVSSSSGGSGETRGSTPDTSMPSATNPPAKLREIENLEIEEVEKADHEEEEDQLDGPSRSASPPVTHSPAQRSLLPTTNEMRRREPCYGISTHNGAPTREKAEESLKAVPPLSQLASSFYRGKRPRSESMSENIKRSNDDAGPPSKLSRLDTSQPSNNRVETAHPTSTPSSYARLFPSPPASSSPQLGISISDSRPGPLWSSASPYGLPAKLEAPPQSHRNSVSVVNNPESSATHFGLKASLKEGSESPSHGNTSRAEDSAVRRSVSPRSAPTQPGESKPSTEIKPRQGRQHAPSSASSVITVGGVHLSFQSFTCSGSAFKAAGACAFCISKGRGKRCLFRNIRAFKWEDNKIVGGSEFPPWEVGLGGFGAVDSNLGESIDDSLMTDVVVQAGNGGGSGEKMSKDALLAEIATEIAAVGTAVTVVGSATGGSTSPRVSPHITYSSLHVEALGLGPTGGPLDRWPCRKDGPVACTYCSKIIFGRVWLCTVCGKRICGACREGFAKDEHEMSVILAEFAGGAGAANVLATSTDGSGKGKSLANKGPKTSICIKGSRHTRKQLKMYWFLTKSEMLEVQRKLENDEGLELSPEPEDAEELGSDADAEGSDDLDMKSGDKLEVRGNRFVRDDDASSNGHPESLAGRSEGRPVSIMGGDSAHVSPQVPAAPIQPSPGQKEARRASNVSTGRRPSKLKRPEASVSPSPPPAQESSTSTYGLASGEPSRYGYPYPQSHRSGESRRRDEDDEAPPKYVYYKGNIINQSDVERYYFGNSALGRPTPITEASYPRPNQAPAAAGTSNQLRGRGYSIEQPRTSVSAIPSSSSHPFPMLAMNPNPGLNTSAKTTISPGHHLHPGTYLPPLTGRNNSDDNGNNGNEGNSTQGPSKPQPRTSFSGTGRSEPREFPLVNGVDYGSVEHPHSRQNGTAACRPKSNFLSAKFNQRADAVNKSLNKVVTLLSPSPSSPSPVKARRHDLGWLGSLEHSLMPLFEWEANNLPGGESPPTSPPANKWDQRVKEILAVCSRVIREIDSRKISPDLQWLGRLELSLTSLEEWEMGQTSG